MAGWVRRAGWIVLAVIGIVAVIGVNPRFALVLGPALLVAAASAWRETRSAALPGWPPVHLRLAHITNRLVIATSVTVAALTAVVLSFHLGDRLPGPPQPSIGLPATYDGALHCTGKCTDWAAEHTLTVIVSGGRARLVDVLATALGERGWRFAKSTAVVDDIHLRFALTGPAQSTPVRWWPFRTTRTLALPEPVPIGDVATLPPGPEAAGLAGPLRADALVHGLDIYLDLAQSSAMTLTFPRLAVGATAPASDPADIAGARQQRVLPVDGYGGASVSLDLVSPVARSEGAARFVALGASGWGWLLVASLSGLLIGRVRAAAAAFARSVLERSSRRRQPRRRASPTGAPGRRGTAGAGRRRTKLR